VEGATTVVDVFRFCEAKREFTGALYPSVMSIWVRHVSSAGNPQT